MDISSAVSIFIIIFSIEWFYTIFKCEKGTLVTATNQTSLDDFDKCIKLYSSKGLPYLIETVVVILQWIFTQTSLGAQWIFTQTSLGVQWIFTQTLLGVQWIFDNKFATIVLILTCLSSYGAAHRQSDAFYTMVDVFHVIREDTSAAFNEIWLSIKNGLITLYRAITVVKFIEIIVIGLFLANAPEALNFLTKSLAKVAKV